MTEKELDYIRDRANKGDTPVQIHEKLSKCRARKNIVCPDLTNIRKSLKGQTHRRGKVETRGRKRVLTKKQVLKVNSTRKKLIKEAKGEREICWSEVIRKSRVPKVSSQTVSRNLMENGLSVKFRRPRTKPMRDASVEAEREEVCGRWRRFPDKYFNKLDLIMDNKFFAIPTLKRAKKFQKMRRVRGHLRTRAEGVKKGFTKPCPKRHRQNPGCSVSVCAGIIGGKVKLWHYLPKVWNGQVAAQTYRGPIRRALKRYVGVKPKYKVLEDNDPVGYKSTKALEAKDELSITAIQYPRYSPDLNPMDFFLWAEVERRMLAGKAPNSETVAQYKARLRRTAFAIPSAVIEKAVANIKSRALAIYKADGGDIQRD